MENDSTQPSPAQQELIDLGTAVLKAGAPSATIITHLLPEDNAVLVVRAGRGGLSAYVAADRSVLLSPSAVPPHQALENFRAGQRTSEDKLGLS